MTEAQAPWLHVALPAGPRTRRGVSDSPAFFRSCRSSADDFEATAHFGLAQQFLERADWLERRTPSSGASEGDA